MKTGLDRTELDESRARRREDSPPPGPATCANTDPSRSPDKSVLAWLELSQGERIHLGPQQQLLLGRARSNQVVLPDDRVSRVHAEIRWAEPRQFWLTELGATNGTLLNGRRLTASVPLCDGDRIEIGPFPILFRHPFSRAATRAVPTHALSAQPHRDRWMLLLRTRRSELPPAYPASPAPPDWLDESKSCIDQRGGTVTQYYEDGLLAAWPLQLGSSAALIRALEELKRQQLKTGNSFSISVHFGPAVIATTQSGLGGALSGPGVGFLLRIQYQADRLSFSRLVSASAQAELFELLPLTRMGVHLLPGVDLEETLYTY